MPVQKVKFMLMAQDMGRALKFHTEIFGFIRGFESDHWSELQHGDAIIAFHGGGNGASNPTSLSIQVDDANATAASIISAGGSILHPPTQRDGEPIKLGTFRDTEGNEIMLTEWVS